MQRSSSIDKILCNINMKIAQNNVINNVCFLDCCIYAKSTLCLKNIKTSPTLSILT